MNLDDYEELSASGLDAVIGAFSVLGSVVMFLLRIPFFLIGLAKYAFSDS